MTMDTQGSIMIVTLSGRDQDGLAGERDAAPARAPATLADPEGTTSAWVHWYHTNDSCTGSVVSHQPKPKPTICATAVRASQAGHATEVCIKPGTLHR
jgi:hypothetical protein